MAAIELTQQQANASGASGPLLRTLAVCDLVDSTALVERLGDQRTAELMRRHDRLARAILHRHGGQEIDKTDGFLLLFERPVQAVAFALEYQRALAELSQSESVSLRARIGIHVGDVLIWENTSDDVSHGAKRVEVEGLVKPVAARLMGLAQPGQILLSSVGYALAQRAQSELAPDQAEPVWKAHGRYRFKGVVDPIVVWEVGYEKLAPFTRPPSGVKAWRVVPWWRRPIALVMESLLLVAAIVFPIYLSTRTESAIAFAPRDWVVIGDLHNLTGQSVFDDSLSVAFRISLEQSRFVNIISDLQVRDALKRMQRPNGAKVDRVTGSEIALREGARALILPTIAEVGGRVRISAEVVDPNTQATVYAETADGSGAGSALPSVDKVTHALRDKLGEALRSIEMNSVPLPKVTTENLDALRAYALANKAHAESKLADSIKLYEQAIELDPNFALAYAGVARVRLSSDDKPGALESLQKAVALRDRLPPRDALYVDALLATYGPPLPMLEKWKLLGQMYPDFYTAHANYALFARIYTNDYNRAIEEAKLSVATQYPRLGNARYLLGTLYLGVEKVEAALEEFKVADQLGGAGQRRMTANAYAVRREFDKSKEVLSRIEATGIATNDVLDHVNEVTLPLDQGQLSAARAAATRAIDSAKNVGPLFERVFRGIDLGLRCAIDPDDAVADDLNLFLQTESRAAADNSDPDQKHAVFATLVGSYLASRIGMTEMAREALTATLPDARGAGYPVLESQSIVAQAELLRATSNAKGAVELLEPLIATGTEPFQAHSAAVRAYQDLGRDVDALRESKWMLDHRGRAYVEYGSYYMLSAMNIADSNLALLDMAQASSNLGQPAEAEKYRRQFLALWPGAQESDWLKRRLEQPAQQR
jgi:putative peptide modification system cyclase